MAGDQSPGRECDWCEEASQVTIFVSRGIGHEYVCVGCLARLIMAEAQDGIQSVIPAWSGDEE